MHELPVRFVPRNPEGIREGRVPLEALALCTKTHLLPGEKIHPRADVVCFICNVRFCRHFLEGRATTLL